MEYCDVLVVGGGPAGSSCAARLRRGGADVLVLDKLPFPRVKPCAGWITPQVVVTLALDTAAYAAAGNVFQPLTGFRTGLMSGPEVETHYDRPVSYGILRRQFDHYLLQRSDARLRLGEPLRSIERCGRRWLVNSEIEAAVLVGAGGHFCPLAQRLGARDNRLASVVAAQEVEFEAAPEDLQRGRIEAEVPELFFCDDLQGYGWCFRKGNHLNIGLGRLDSQHLARHVAQFCELLRQRGKLSAPIPDRFHGHAYQLYERIAPQLADDGILLIGDAAGLAYAHSGEGIRPAIESGLIAADVLLAAGGDYSLNRLEPYRLQLTKRCGKPQGAGPTDWLPVGMLQFLAARLFASRWFSRRVLLDRWFLRSAEPVLTSAP